MRRHLALALAAVPLVACAGGGPDGGPDGEGTAGGPEPGDRPSASAPPDPSSADPSPPEDDATGSSGAPERDRTPPRVVDTVADGLSVPWGLDFLPDGRAVVTERDSRRVLTVTPEGRVRRVGLLEQAAPQGEAGLLGVAVSPRYAADRTLYFYLSTATDNRVVRAELRGGRLGPTSVVLDGIPQGFVHDGGRLAFGPDGHLVVSTGEVGEEQLAQDRDSLAGKVLRITTGGRPAPGNPDPRSPVWTWGHRNVQGLAFDDAGRLWASEFGADAFDELNLLRPGRNYGWPVVEGRGGPDRFVEPQQVWETATASPSGLAWQDGRLWMASLRGERLWRVDVVDGRAVRPRGFLVGSYGRLRTVAVAPDGRLWVTTSNRDGRGDPAPRDDRILLVEP